MESTAHYVFLSSVISGSRPAVGSGAMMDATTCSSLGRWLRVTQKHS
jgi:hypothetical protein